MILKSLQHKTHKIDKGTKSRLSHVISKGDENLTNSISRSLTVKIKENPVTGLFAAHVCCLHVPRLKKAHVCIFMSKDKTVDHGSRIDAYFHSRDFIS